MKEVNKKKKDTKDRWTRRATTTKIEPIVGIQRVGDRLICATAKALYTMLVDKEPL